MAVMKKFHQAPPFDQSSGRELEIHQTDDILPADCPHPLSQRFQLSDYVCSADKSPNGAAADDIWMNVSFCQGFDDPYMRPTARRAASQGKANGRSCHVNSFLRLNILDCLTMVDGFILITNQVGIVT